MIVDKIFPNWQTVDTTFIDASFAVNAESLLALNPDIISIMGICRKRGSEKLQFPVWIFMLLI